MSSTRSDNSASLASLAGFHLGGPGNLMTRLYQLLWPRHPADFESRSPPHALLPWLDRLEPSPPLEGQSDADADVEMLGRQFLYLDLTKWSAFRSLVLAKHRVRSRPYPPRIQRTLGRPAQGAWPVLLHWPAGIGE